MIYLFYLFIEWNKNVFKIEQLSCVNVENGSEKNVK